jgi:hypothetical protein
MTSSLLAMIPSLMDSTFGTKKVLSKTNDVSYTGRGLYRVDQTPNDRKGDYFFRDFFMVQVCAYMTEIGFRGLDRTYYSPLMTQALNLHKLTSLQYPYLKSPTRQAAPLYPGARNYEQLPELFRNQAMGSLVSKDTQPLVPKVLKELEIDKLEKQFGSGDKEQFDTLKNLILQPNHDALYLEKHVDGKFPTLTPAERGQLVNSIKELAYTENLTTRKGKYKAFFKANPLKGKVPEKALKDAVQLEESRQAGILFDHLHKHLNFDEYMNRMLTNQGQVTDEQAKAVLTHLEDLRALHAFQASATNATEQKVIPAAKAWVKASGKNNPKAVREAEQKLTEARNAIAKHLQPDGVFSRGTAATQKEVMSQNPLAHLDRLIAAQKNSDKTAVKEASRKFQAALGSVSDTVKAEHPNHLAQLEQTLSAQFKDEKLAAKLTDYVAQGFSSKNALDAFKKIQKMGTWPKMLSVVLLNFVFYGGLATQFDNKMLQPYQAKLVKERGTSSDIVKAGYTAFLPSLGLFIGGMTKVAPDWVKRLGHLGRFATVGGLALSTFAGGTLGILKLRLKNPPKNKPQTPSTPGAPQNQASVPPSPFSLGQSQGFPPPSAGQAVFSRFNGQSPFLNQVPLRSSSPYVTESQN